MKTLTPIFPQVLNLRVSLERVVRYSLRLILMLSISALSALPAQAERLKDLANIQGVRSNQLIGYGLVVGLDGTGDQTTQTPFTLQTTLSMLQQMGVVLPPGTAGQMQLKNIAAVMVTADLPAFAQAGQTLDITVSSMANAKSLRGGTLMMSPLKGADGQVYAIAQGNLVVAGAGAAANGTEVQINQLGVGRISAGATVEKSVANDIAQVETFNLELKQTDFSTANMVMNAINKHFGRFVAQAQDGRVITVQPRNFEGQRVAFMAELENINITPLKPSAKVILNARTGSIVLNQSVTLDSCAVAHGNLSVTITTTPQVSQPNAFGNGRTVETKTSSIDIDAEPGRVIKLDKGASLADVVRALNAVGATPQDLLAILQAIKAAGALHADLEVI
jgi:flagellar P-ring protein precursor FlgI